jgi:hypothetical protein
MTLRPDQAALVALCERLTDATWAGTVEWDDEHDDHYLWTSSSGRASVGSRDRNGYPPYELSIFNAHGEKVEELHTGVGEDDTPASWNGPLAELYRVARRSALRADEIIEALMTAIPVAQNKPAAEDDFWETSPSVAPGTSAGRVDKQ